MKNTLGAIRRRFTVISSTTRRKDLEMIEVENDTILPLLSWLKHHTPLVQLTHVTAVDWIEEEQFQLSYLLTDPVGCTSLIVSTRIDRNEAEMESIHTLWPQAVTYEQEINEMFGIFFPGSPRQGVSFILEDWKDIPPMRRDFDTLEYTREHHPFRPGREHIDPRAYIGRVVGERGYHED